MNYKKVRIIMAIYYIVAGCLYYFISNALFLVALFLIGLTLHVLLEGFAKDNEIIAQKTKEYEEYKAQQKN